MIPQELCEKAESLGDSLQQVYQASEGLLVHCSHGDQQLVRDKTQRLRQRFDDLLQSVHNKEQNANDTAEKSRTFFHLKDHLIAWCKEVDNRLAGVMKDDQEAKGEDDNLKVGLVLLSLLARHVMRKIKLVKLSVV